MNADIYERHRQAVETWREACQNVEFAEKQRDEARAALDNATGLLIEFAQLAAISRSFSNILN